MDVCCTTWVMSFYVQPSSAFCTCKWGAGPHHTQETYDQIKAIRLWLSHQLSGANIIRLRNATSRAKNWVSAYSQLSSTLIKLELILRPDNTLFFSLSSVFEFLLFSTFHTEEVIANGPMQWQTAVYLQGSDSPWAVGEGWGFELKSRSRLPGRLAFCGMW